MSNLPRLAVFHNEQSSPVFELFGASKDLCRIVWIIGWSNDNPSQRILSRFGDVVDLTGLTEAQSIERLVEFRPDGVVVFNDPPIMLASKVAHELDLPFHSPATAELLSDKLAQRAALRDAGLPVPAFAALSTTFTDAHVPFPAVLKPRAGAGSRDTFFVHDARQVADALAKCDPNEEFILEEWLPDRSSRQGLGSDLVSVESVVRDGDITNITVTGRFPFAPPFRETGSFMPSDVNETDWNAVLELASTAITALGIKHGLVHTEIKMTPQGARIVEVNGRLGGGIDGLIRRLGGPSLLVWSMKLALGQDVGPTPVILKSPVAFFRLIVAPQTATELESLSGVNDLNALSGIDEVNLNAQPGDALDYRRSSFSQNILWINGAVGSHAELNQLVHEQIESTLHFTWKFN